MRHQIQFDVDLTGKPEIPMDLQMAYRRMNLRDRQLNPNGDEQAMREAKKVYALWKDNGFRELKITVEDYDRGQSEFCNGDNADYFTQEFPGECDCSRSDIADGFCDHKKYGKDDELEYDRDVAFYEMNTAQAGAWCNDCPLRAICLASSITKESVDRSGYVKFGELAGVQDVGVYGGYGQRARTAIMMKVLDLFYEEFGEVPEEYRVYKDSEGGFYGYDRDEFGAMLPRPKAISTVTESREMDLVS